MRKSCLQWLIRQAKDEQVAVSDGTSDRAALIVKYLPSCAAWWHFPRTLSRLRFAAAQAHGLEVALGGSCAQCNLVPRALGVGQPPPRRHEWSSSAAALACALSCCEVRSREQPGPSTPHTHAQSREHTAPASRPSSCVALDRDDGRSHRQVLVKSRQDF